MKKLLLLAAGAMLATTGMAQSWALVGVSTDWGLNEDFVFTAEGDIYTLEVATLLNGFKVVPLNEDNSLNWDYDYSTSTPIELGVTYTLDARDGGPDLDNMAFAGDIFSVNDALITWNPTTAAFLIEGEAVMQENDGSVIYLVGSPQDWNINGDSMPLMAVSEGVYEAVYEIPANPSFRFYTKLSNWEANSIGSQVPDNALQFEMVDGVYSGECVEGKGSWNLTNWEGGEMTLVVDLNNMTVTFTAGDAAVEGIAADINAPAVYYNLQGVRVANPQNGLYIVKQGNKTSKVLVR